jgi:hypothetical protein
VQCLVDEAVWKASDAGVFDMELLSIGPKITVVEIAGIVYGLKDSLIPYSTMKVATDGYSSCQ